MLDKLHKQIDAVAISTPDHTHFPIAMAAMELGKHVFVQKPLAHNIWQVRTLRKAARRYGVITQMGNQGHTFEGMRRIKEWVAAGVIGDVSEVVTWTNRPNPPWFVPPASFPPPTSRAPSDLDWDLWQGPVAAREYSRAYVPIQWRGWWDYGCGSLGDIGCHTFDAPFWALDLGAPTRVQAFSGPASRRRLHLDEVGGHLPVPGTRRQAAGHADLVREGLRRAEAEALGSRKAPGGRGRNVHGRDPRDALPRRHAAGEPDDHPGRALHGDQGRLAQDRQAAARSGTARSRSGSARSRARARCRARASTTPPRSPRWCCSAPSRSARAAPSSGTPRRCRSRDSRSSTRSSRSPPGKAGGTARISAESMGSRNVTVVLEEQVALWARVEAARRDTSVSRLLGDLLKQQMSRDMGYEQAMRSALRREPFLATDSRYLERDQLHERSRLR